LEKLVWETLSRVIDEEKINEKLGGGGKKEKKGSTIVAKEESRHHLMRVRARGGLGKSPDRLKGREQKVDLVGRKGLGGW